ncbi:MBG domain-containing protein [Myroides sp. LJL110]
MFRLLQCCIALFFVTTTLAQSGGIELAPTKDNVIYVSPNGTGDGSSWANSVDLAEALRWVKGKDGYKIWIKEGTYLPKYDVRYNYDTQEISATKDPQKGGFVITSSIEIYGGFKGDETSLNQRDWAANKTYLSGDLAGSTKVSNQGELPVTIKDNTKNTARVLYIAAKENAKIIVDGVIIYGGYAKDGGLTIFQGTSSFASNNSAALGVITQSTDAKNIDIVFSHVHFYGNYSVGNGAVYSSTGNDKYSIGVNNNSNNSIYFVNCLLERNYSANSAGSIMIEDSSHLVLLNSTIANNYASLFAGGPKFEFYGYASKPLSSSTAIWNSIIYENRGVKNFNEIQYVTNIAAVLRDTVGSSVIGRNDNNSIDPIPTANNVGGNSRTDLVFYKNTNINEHPYFSINPIGKNKKIYGGNKAEYEKVINKFGLDSRDFNAKPRNGNISVTQGAYEMQCDFVPAPVTQTEVIYAIGDTPKALEATGDNLYWAPSDKDGDIDVDKISQNPITPDISKVGTFTYYVYSQAENYCISEIVEIKVKVVQQAIKVEVDSFDKFYGEEDPEFTYNLAEGSKLPNGITFIGALAREDSEEIGTYNINKGTLSFSKDADKYDLIVIPGTLTINPAIVQIVPTTLSKYFGQDEPVLNYTVNTLEGVYKDGGITGELTREPGEDVEKYLFLTTSLQSAKGKNDKDFYTIKISQDDRFQILPAELQIIPKQGQSKVYGEKDPYLEFDTNLIKGKLDIQELNIQLTREQGENVEKYLIKLADDYETNTNIDVEFNSGVFFNITKRDLTLTPTPVSTVYGSDSVDIPYEITSGSLAPGDELQGSLNRSCPTCNDVDTYFINGENLEINNSLTQESRSENYNFIVIPEVTYTILPADITITADDINITFNENQPDLSYHISQGELFYQDEISGSLTREPGNDVGNYDISTSELTVIPNVKNYNITRKDGVFTISKARFEGITLESVTYEYDGKEVSVSVQGAEGQPFLGDVVYTYYNKGDRDNPLLTNPVDAGEYEVQASLTNPNYEELNLWANLVITPSNDFGIIELKNKSFVYDGSIKSIEASGEGILDTDEFIYSYTNDSQVVQPEDVINVGVYKVIATLNRSPNYVQWQSEAFLSINPAEITGLTFDSKNVTATGSPIQVEVTGDQADNFDIQYTYFKQDNTPFDPNQYPSLPGTYKVKAVANGDSESPNYNSNYNSWEKVIDLTIVAIQADGNMNSQEVDYNGKPHFLVVEGTNLPPQDQIVYTYTNNAIPSEVYTQANPPVKAGVYNVVAQIPAYNVPNGPSIDAKTLESTLTITQIEAPFLKITSVSEMYEGKKLDFPVELEPSVDGATFTSSIIYKQGDNVISDGPIDVGQYDVEITLEGSSDDSKRNYKTTFRTGTFIITKATLDLSFNSANFSYDGTPKSLVVIDNQTGEVVEAGKVQYNNNQKTQVGEYNVTATVNYGDNYTQKELQATLTIVAKELYIKANGQKTVYGQTIAAPTYQVEGLVQGQDKEQQLTGSLAYYLADKQIASPKDVNTYDILQGTLRPSNENYIIKSYVSANLEITKANLKIQPDVVLQVYGNSDISPIEYTYQGLISSDNIANVLQGELSRSEGIKVGRYAVSLGTLKDISGNYNIELQPTNYTIIPRELIVIASPVSVSYGQEIPDFKWEAVNFAFDDTDDLFIGGLYREDNNLNVGTYPILGDRLSAGENYTIQYKGANLQILAKELLVTAQANTKVYGDKDPVLSYKVQGLAYGDNSSGALQGSLARQQGEDKGVYKILQGDLSPRNDNYFFSFVESTFTITPATLFVAALPSNKTYGESDPDFSYKVSGYKLEDQNNPTVLSGSLQRETPTVNKVGSYSINQGSLITNNNYEISYTSSQFVIHPGTLIVQAIDHFKEYGDVDPTLTYTVNGFVYGDTPQSVLQGELSRETGTRVYDNYKIEQGSLKDISGNYQIYFSSGVFKIIPAPLMVTANKQAKVYGDVDPFLSYNLVGLKNNDTVDTVLFGALSRESGEDVGNYQIRKGNLFASPNYELNFISNTLDITAAMLEIQAKKQTKVYGAPDPVFTYDINGLSFQDKIKDVLQGSLTREQGENVGTYKILADQLIINENYHLVYTPSDLEITKAPLTIKVNGQSKFYGQNDPILSYSLNGVANPDQESNVVKGKLIREQGENVGKYKVLDTELVVSDNYSYDFINTDFTITAAVLNVRANNTGKDYGSSDPEEFTFISSGYGFNDTPQSVLTGALSRTQGESVGTYAIEQGTLKTNDNYTMEFTPGSFSIVAGEISVIAEPATKVYGSEEPFLTYQVIGLKEGEQVVGNLTRVPGEDVGSYDINQGTLKVVNKQGNSQYKINFTSSVLKITPAKLTVQASKGAHKEYGSEDPVFSYTVSGLKHPDTMAIFVGELQRDQGQGIGQYNINQGDLSAGKNYEIDFIGSQFVITPKQLIIQVEPTGKVYGAKDPVLVYHTDGLLQGDVLTGSLSREEGESVGEYEIKQGTLKASENYTVSYKKALFTISKAPLRIIAENNSKLYGQVDPVLKYTVQGLVNSDEKDLVVKGALNRAAGESIGSYDIEQGSLNAGGNYLIDFQEAIFEIKKAPITVVLNNKQKTYGQADPYFDYQVVGETGSEELVLTGTPIREKGQNVGEYKIKMGSLTAPANFDVTFIEGTLTINPKELQVKANASSKSYTQIEDPELTYISSGYAYQDKQSEVLTGSLTREPGSDVGDYDIMIGSLKSNENYFIKFDSNLFSIIQSQVRIIADNQTKVYGEPDQPLTYTVIGLAAGDKVSGDLQIEKVDGKQPQDVGVYKILQGSLTIDSNYEVVFVAADLHITKADLYIDAVDTTKIYGTPDPVLSYQVKGIVNNDTPGDVIQGELVRMDSEDVGSYVISQGTLNVSDNYQLFFQPASFTISKAVLTLQADNLSKIYGQSDPDLTYKATGLLQGDKLTGSLHRKEGNLVGNYPILLGSLSAGENYQIDYQQGILSIEKATLQVVVNDKEKVYGGVDPTLDYSLKGLVNNDAAYQVLSGSLLRISGENVGKYPIVQGSLLSNGNYNLEFTPGELAITKSNLTVTAHGQIKTYGQADPLLTYSVKGLKNKDLQSDAILKGKLSREKGENVGIYDIVGQDLEASANYQLIYQGAALQISAANLNVKANPDSKVHGDIDPEFTYSVTGFAYQDQAIDVLTGSLSRVKGEDIGVYPILQGDLVANANYNIEFKENEFRITELSSVTVTAQSKFKTYGQQDPKLTYVVSGLAQGETLSGNLIRTGSNQVGTYVIEQGDLQVSSGRPINFISSELTITPAELTIKPQELENTKVYGSVDPILSYDILGLMYDESPEFILSGSLSRDFGENVGSYPIKLGSLKANRNYKVNLIASEFKITKANVTIKAISNEKVYGQQDPLLSYEIQGLLDKDVVTGSLQRDPGQNVGTYSIVLGTLDVGDNYEVGFKGAEFSILPAELIIQADDNGKVYGSADPILTYRVTGLVNNDVQVNVLTGSLKREPGQNVGTYSIDQGSLQANTNYQINYTPGHFFITPTVLTVTAEQKSKVYGQSDPALSFTTQGLTNGDLVGDVFIGELQRQPGEDVGTYLIEQGSLESSLNYMIFFERNELIITPKTLQVKANYLSKVEGDKDPLFTYLVHGAIASEATEDLIIGDLTREPGENVGVYRIDQGTLHSITPNYTIDFTPGALIIARDQIVVTANYLAKTYGSNDPELTYSFSGLGQGQSITGTLTREPGQDVGSYEIMQGSLKINDGSLISFYGSNLDITPKMLKVKAISAQKIYADQDPGLTYSVDGLVESSTPQDIFSGSLKRQSGENVGTYLIEKGNLSPNSNYQMDFQNGVFTILKAKATVEIENLTKDYGQIDPPFKYSVTGLLNNDALQGELYRIAGENVGDYAITPGSLRASNNYELVFNQAKLTILPSNLQVIAMANEKMYLQEDPVFTYRVTGLKGSDQIQSVLKGSLSRDLGENVGVYPINIGSLQSNANYKISFQGSNLTITALPLEVKADRQSKVYGTTDPNLSYQVIGLPQDVDADKVFQGTLSRAIGQDVGSYPIGIGTLNAGSNYSVVFTGSELQITRATLVVEAQANSKVYNQIDPSLTIKVLGLVNQDTQEQVLSGQVQRQQGENAGVYQIEQGSLQTNKNYYLNFVSANFTILKADQKIIGFDSAITLDYPKEKSVQLNASSSSGLPLTYSYSNMSPANFAKGTSNGFVSVTGPGVMIVTAMQEGDQNYNTVVASQDFIVETKENTSLKIDKLLVNGAVYDPVNTYQVVDLGCLQGDSPVVIEVVANENYSVKPSRNIIIPVVNGKPTSDYVLITVSDQDGFTSIYEIKLESNVDTSKILMTKYNNLLFINNNPKTNGGYVFDTFEIFKEGELISSGQVYSAGPVSDDKIDFTASYSAVLTTKDGRVIQTCEINFKQMVTNAVTVAPNPVRVGENLTVRYDIDSNDFHGASYRLFSGQGQLVDYGQLPLNESAIPIKENLSYGVYYLVVTHNGKQNSFTIMVIK